MTQFLTIILCRGVIINVQVKHDTERRGLVGYFLPNLIHSIRIPILGPGKGMLTEGKAQYN
jgi:hypothetical protein